MPRVRVLSVIALAGLLCSACLPRQPSGGGSGPESSAGGSSPARPRSSASSSPVPPGTHTMPWPDEVYVGAESPDRPGVEVPGATPPGFVEAPPGSGVDRYLGQQLNWQPCPDKPSHRCTKFAAPLDWENPDGQAITIAMRLVPAAQESTGYLFVNPGGPGGSAQDYAAGFDATGLEHYSIVGLDSRGSGESTPVVCGSGPETDEFYNADSTPDDQAERDALVAAQQRFNQQCRDHSGALLDHISTIETVYDYDLARQLLGQQKLDFYGVSYGTFLGAVYAELYPQNAGRLVLDSAVNLIPDSEVIQAQGFDLSMRNFAKWCAAERDCGLGDSEDAVVDRVVGFLNGLDAHPLPGDQTRQLTQSLAVTGLILFFYFGSDEYPTLSKVLADTMASGDGGYLLRAADSMNERLPDGTYGGLTYAFPAIRCADSADHGVAAAFDDWLGENSARAPIFGPLFGPDLVCPLWTARPAPQIDFSGTGAPPILIVQNTGDSATPYQNAQIMAEELESAVLVSRDAPGHGAYTAGSACMDTIVRDYLNDGTVPKEGITCTDG